MAMKPQLGNTKINLKTTMDNNSEFKASAWLTVNNGWDDANNRPVPMTHDQEEKVRAIHAAMIAAGVELQISLNEKIGPEPRQWPLVNRMRLFCNEADKPSGAAPSVAGDFM